MLDTWEKILDPNFINAELIGSVGAERVVTIKDIDLAEVFNQKSNSKDKKQTLFLEECKPMVLNKTNTKSLMKIFGSDDPQKCVGHKITLYVAPVKVAGQQTTGIRIKEYNEIQIKCEKCGNIIKPLQTKSVAELVEISKKNFKKALCNDCMKEIAKENGENGK